MHLNTLMYVVIVFVWKYAHILPHPNTGMHRDSRVSISILTHLAISQSLTCHSWHTEHPFVHPFQGTMLLYTKNLDIEHLNVIRFKLVEAVKKYLVLDVNRKTPKYSEGLNTKHLNIKPIQNPNILKIGIGMVWFWNGQDYSYSSRTGHSAM